MSSHFRDRGRGTRGTRGGREIFLKGVRPICKKNPPNSFVMGCSNKHTHCRDATRALRATYLETFRAGADPGSILSHLVLVRQETVTWGGWTWAMDSGSRVTGGGSGYAAILAHAGGVLYGTELGSVTLKRVGLFCFPIKHSTHTLVQRCPARGPKARTEG